MTTLYDALYYHICKLRNRIVPPVFKMDEGLEQIKVVIEESTDTYQGMKRLLDYCSRIAPSYAWKSMDRWDKSDYEKSNLKIQHWLEDVLTKHPPRKNIKALYFGLFDGKYGDNVIAPAISISGSTSFDPDDKTGDWACLDEDSYKPEGSYIGSSILKAISLMMQLKECIDVRKIGEYILYLGYAALVVKAACSAIDPKLLEGKNGRRPIAVGFDEGDFILIQ